MAERIDARFPDNRTVFFGHIGDGNLHVSTTVGPDSMARHDEVDEIIYSLTAEVGGSISAEHGIGQMKVEELAHYRSRVELDTMRAIKRALDPQNLMNPGKILNLSS